MLETHFEKNLVINNRELSYQGKFKVEDLFMVINREVTERGYTRREKKTEERVGEESKKVLVELRPFKVKTEYVTLMIKIRIFLEVAGESIEEFQGIKHKFQQGKVTLTFDAWSLTDYESRWGMKPWAYFLKGVINKYLYTFPTEAGFTGELAGDTGYVVGEVKKLLKSYESKEVKLTKEEDVKNAILEEVEREKKETSREESAGWGAD